MGMGMGSSKPPFTKQLEQTASGQEVLKCAWGRASPGDLDDWPPSLITLVSTILASPVPMMVAWGPSLRSCFNDAFRPLLGDRLSCAMGMPFQQLSEGLWEGADHSVAKILGGESLEVINTRLDGLHSPGSDDAYRVLTCSPVRDDGGAIAGLLCVIRDTTDRLFAERERRRAAEHFQATLAAGDFIGTWHWDVLNDRVFTDERFALIYGVDPDRAIQGVPLAEFIEHIHPDDRPLVETQIGASLRYGDEYNAEYRVWAANGDILWIAAQGTAVLDEQGRCVRFRGISFDITVNKTIEKARHGPPAQSQRGVNIPVAMDKPARLRHNFIESDL
jgi:PAS domain-containing protein